MSVSFDVSGFIRRKRKSNRPAIKMCADYVFRWGPSIYPAPDVGTCLYSSPPMCMPLHSSLP